MLWNEMSRNDQNALIVKLFGAIVSAGLCATKGRKPISDIQMVIERKFNVVLNSVEFSDRVKALLNKGDERLVQKIERQKQMLLLLASL